MDGVGTRGKNGNEWRRRGPGVNRAMGGRSGSTGAKVRQDECGVAVGHQVIGAASRGHRLAIPTAT